MLEVDLVDALGVIQQGLDIGCARVESGEIIALLGSERVQTPGWRGSGYCWKSGNGALTLPMRRLEALNDSSRPEDMNVPGFDFHAMKGFRPTRYSVHVNGPWCITFELEDGDAWRVDLEQYH